MAFREREPRHSSEDRRARKPREQAEAPDARTLAIKARSLALDRLTVREYSASELRAYLKRKGIAAAEAEELVSELVREGFVDDKRYARIVARHQAMRDKGPAYILMKLRQKGVRSDLRETQELYAETSDRQETEAVRSVLERRYPRALEPKADSKEKARAYQGLVRRGFSSAAIQKCLFGKGDLE